MFDDDVVMDTRPKWWRGNGRFGRLAREDLKIYPQADGRYRQELWNGGVEGTFQEYPDLAESAARALAEIVADKDGAGEPLAGWRDMSGTHGNGAASGHEKMVLLSASRDSTVRQQGFFASASNSRELWRRRVKTVSRPLTWVAMATHSVWGLCRRRGRPAHHAAPIAAQDCVID